MNKIGLLVFIFLQVILWIYLGDAFIHPGKYVYTFGGDGAFIYYNMIFHTFFGDGFLLESMNFPKHESIFMTDAQAGLALIFSFLNDVFPSLLSPEAVVGLSHRFHYLMIGFAGVYLFKGMSILGINKNTAAIASVFITLLSPMMIRLAAGHFGLAYPFVFAFTFYFLIKSFFTNKYDVKIAIAFALVILFFGVNNFYIGMINLTFSLLFAVFMLLFQEHRKNGFILLIHVIGLVIILYSAIHFTDPGMNRVEIQWGYDFNKASLKSFFIPPTSLIYSFLSKFKSLPSLGMEAWINVGFASTLIILFSIPFIFIRQLKFDSQKHKLLFIGLGSSCLIMFLYASAFFYQFDFVKEHLFHKIGLLTMFKASARFAWPIYFSTAFLAIYLFQKAIVKLPEVLKIILCALLIVGSAYETHLYLTNHVFQNKYSNPYSQAKKDTFIKLIEENKIDLNEYQALYSVPVMEGWNDKFQIVPHFQTEYNSILFSMSTGMPMINGMLSRIGVTDAAESIQLSAHPLIKREKLQALKSQKSILLVYGKGVKSLTKGEEYLLSKSVLLADEKDFQLRRLSLSALEYHKTTSEYETYFDSSDVSYNFHIHEGFDKTLSEETFAGSGSLQINRDSIFFETKAEDTIDSIECSIFVKLDNKMFGNPQFELTFIGQDDEVIKTTKFNAYQSRDYQLGWIRAAVTIDVPANFNKIQVSASEINQSFMVDELCLKSIDKPVLSIKPNGDKLYDNYFIQE